MYTVGLLKTSDANMCNLKIMVEQLQRHLDDPSTFHHLNSILGSLEEVSCANEAPEASCSMADSQAKYAACFAKAISALGDNRNELRCKRLEERLSSKLPMTANMTPWMQAQIDVCLVCLHCQSQFCKD